MSKKNIQRQNKRHLQKIRQKKQSEIEEKINDLNLPGDYEIKLSEMEITYEGMPTKAEKHLSKADLKSLEDCYQVIIKPLQFKHFQDAIELLEALKEKYPDSDKVYNYLGIAYDVAQQPEKAAAIKKEAYEKNPDYLFGKLAYAQVCLNNGNYEQIPIIFDNQFDLPLLYPKRKKFHISEAQSFYCIIGLYFCYTDNKNLAKGCLRILKIIDAEKRFISALKRALTKKRISNFLKMFKSNS